MKFHASARILILSGILLVVLKPPCASCGILTDRMSRHELKIWNSIRRTVLAQNKHGLTLHPKIQDLWRGLEAGEHEVHVEMTDRDGGYSVHAGRFAIEVLDPAGKRHVCVIRLYLSAIRRAYAKPSAMRPDEFVPFAGLGTTDRYTEVLGHEMAHAVSILQDPDCLRFYLEMEKEIAEYDHLLQSRDVLPGALEGHLDRIRTLQQLLERPAEAAEADIWRELSPVIPRTASGKRASLDQS
jgi:hypothetical protein